MHIHRIICFSSLENSRCVTSLKKISVFVPRTWKVSPKQIFGQKVGRDLVLQNLATVRQSSVVASTNQSSGRDSQYFYQCHIFEPQYLTGHFPRLKSQNKNGQVLFSITKIDRLILMRSTREIFGRVLPSNLFQNIPFVLFRSLVIAQVKR